jgi:hypothetical protein
MKPRSVRLRLRTAVCILALACAAVPSAQAFLWGSPVRRWIREADKALEEGRTAETQKRVLDACDAYSRAHELYLKAQTDSPKTQAEHVATQDAECRTRLRTLFALASTGKLETPPPEDVMPSSNAGTAAVAESRATAPEEIPATAVATTVDDDPIADEPTEPEITEGAAPVPARRRTWLGRLLRGDAKNSEGSRGAPDETDAVVPDATEQEPSLATKPATVPATTPPRSAGRPATEPRPGRETPETPPASAAIRPAKTGPVPAAPTAPTSDVALSRKVQKMLSEGAGADAVILLESVVEDAGPEATLTQKLLFAQALMHRRNYARAESILTPLLEQHGDDPSVLMLASGLQLAQGNPFAALRLLDRLVQKYPRFADAYINLAYTRFAMDPTANRDEAIVYYRHALTLGAERDPRLEMELRVNLEP